MTAPLDGPDPDGELSPTDRVWLQEAGEISRDYPGVAVFHDVQGFWAVEDGERVGPVSCPLALRAMLGLPKPGKAAP